eukprot:7388323-Prymnesium_polylepis.1
MHGSTFGGLGAAPAPAAGSGSTFGSFGAAPAPAAGSGITFGGFGAAPAPEVESGSMFGGFGAAPAPAAESGNPFGGFSAGPSGAGSSALEGSGYLPPILPRGMSLFELIGPDEFLLPDPRPQAPSIPEGYLVLFEDVAQVYIHHPTMEEAAELQAARARAELTEEALARELKTA